MPLPPLQIRTTSVAALLIADVQAAWTLTCVFTDAPETPAKETDLPRAFVEMDKVAFGARGASIRNAAAAQSWRITYQGLKQRGTPVRVQRETATNALLERITAAPDYHGYLYDRSGVEVEMGNQTEEAGEIWFSVTIIFPVSVVQ